MNISHQLHTPPAGPFTARLWKDNEDLIDKIFNHPFCRGLSNGSLPSASFRHYLQQDALYIKQNARAFTITAGKSNSSEAFSFFLNMAKDGLEIERVLHQNLMPAFNIFPVREMSTVCNNYTSFLLNTALNESFRVSAASLLPCFWVYRETGLNIRRRSVNSNPFQPWLDTYSDDIYATYVEKFVNMVEEETVRASEREKHKIFNAFHQSILFELDFFSEAWHFRTTE